MRHLNATLFVAAILFFCGGSAGQTTDADRADTIVINANVRTLDPARPRASAIAIRNGKIIAVGELRDVERSAGPDTVRIDAGGRLVLPGFNDSHVHMLGVGNWFSHIDMRDEKSLASVIDRLANAAEVLPSGRWILGSGLTMNGDRADHLPARSQLDRISAENPILIYINGYSAGLVNTAAIRIAGMLSDAQFNETLQPPDAVAIIRGASLDRVRRAVPADHGTNIASIIETAANHAARSGVTSIQDVHSDDLFELLSRLDANGRLNTRVYDCIGINDSERLIRAGVKAADGTERVRRGCVKSDTVETPDEVNGLAETFIAADKAGLQIMVHSIGGREIRHTVDAAERLVRANGRRDRRFRVEHGTGASMADVERARRSDLIFSMQPFLFWRGAAAAGDDHRAMITTGLRLTFGSDASMVSIDPLLGIHAAVNAGKGSISVEQAVNLYTVGSAYAEFQEDLKGTVAIGKLADLVMLSDDIFSVRPTEIRRTRIDLTIMDGRVVYRSEKMFDNLDRGKNRNEPK